MICTQDEEVESLQAIFCKTGEFTQRKETNGLHITVTFDFSSMVNSRMTRQCFDQQQNDMVNSRMTRQCFDHRSDGISFFLVPDYPLVEPPRISVRCSYLPTVTVDAIKLQVEERAAALLGQSILLDLCSLTQELLEKEIESLQTTAQRADNHDNMSVAEETAAIIDRHLQDQTGRENSSLVAQGFPCCAMEIKTTDLHIANDKCIESVLSHCQKKDTNMVHEGKAHDKCGQNFNKIESDSKVVTALLQLDHMRSQQSYVKLIKKWTVELGLTGRLVFCRKLILILLQGTSKSVREYIVRNRTTNVDVDAKGRVCKERMLTVLCEVPGETHIRLSEFCVLELPTTESLQEFFRSSGMENLYMAYLSHLVCTSYTKKKPG